MKKATIILVILLSALNTHTDAQNLTKEQCLKYIMDLYNEDNQSRNETRKWTFENIRLEYDNLKFDLRDSDNGKVTGVNFRLTGIYIYNNDNSGLLNIKNSLEESMRLAIESEKPSEKERIDKMLKALKYLSQFATKDPFAN
jgi:hypothetical protein